MEAAAFLGVSVKTLRSWRSTGSASGLPVTRMGRLVMYPLKELERYMEERTIQH
jgi:predicted site-specific integrase-resolvase